MAFNDIIYKALCVLQVLPMLKRSIDEAAVQSLRLYRAKSNEGRRVNEPSIIEPGFDKAF